MNPLRYVRQKLGSRFWGIVSFLITGTIALAQESTFDATGFSIARDAQRVRVQEKGVAVLEFQFGAQQLTSGKPYRRAHYIHPLYALDGAVISEDFPGDHRHHRGVFWSWHQVLVAGKQAGDAWLCDDFQWDSQRVDTTIRGGTAQIDATAIWRSADVTDPRGNLIDIATDQAKIAIHPREENSRAIDLTLRLQALVPDVRIGGSDDAKGYGGFSTRIRMPDGLQFFGESGPLAPAKLAVTSERWVLFRADEFSYAIIVAATNPGQTNQWILRQKRSMQNPVFPGRQTVALSQESPTVLRYRIVILDGGAQQTRDQQQQIIRQAMTEFDDGIGSKSDGSAGDNSNADDRSMSDDR